MDLMIDSNHAYSLKEALEVLHMHFKKYIFQSLIKFCKLSRKVEDQDIFFFEEPVSPEMYHQYAELRQRTSIPIAGGECEYLRFGFKTLLESKSVDIIQVK